MDPHVPLRPDWNCAGCGAPWPCRDRRRRWTVEYPNADLSLWLLLAARYVEAAEDLRHVPAAELHRRFLGWLGRRPYRDDPG